MLSEMSIFVVSENRLTMKTTLLESLLTFAASCCVWCLACAQEPEPVRNVPAPDVRLVQASLEERSLAEMLERVGKRFGVRVRCKRCLLYTSDAADER